MYYCFICNDSELDKLSLPMICAFMVEREVDSSIADCDLTRPKIKFLNLNLNLNLGHERVKTSAVIWVGWGI